MTYFKTASHFMAMSMATKFNFLGLKNFGTLYNVSTLLLHDYPFNLLVGPVVGPRDGMSVGLWDGIADGELLG